MRAQIIAHEGGDPALAIADAFYPDGSAEYLNVFRYFAKLLCCHIAHSEGPIPLRMSSFAVGNNDQNCVWLRIKRDWTYSVHSRKFGDHGFAAHGGLVIYGDKKASGVKAFHSTLTLGSVQYVFFSRLFWVESLELKLMHKKYNRRMIEINKTGLLYPLKKEEEFSLGLSDDESQA